MKSKCTCRCNRVVCFLLHGSPTLAWLPVPLAVLAIFAFAIANVSPTYPVEIRNLERLPSGALQFELRAGRTRQVMVYRVREDGTEVLVSISVGGTDMYLPGDPERPK